MTHFVIHTGPHKTGTSYLQEGLTKLRPDLTKRGIHYPTIWGPIAHHKLLERLKSIPDPVLEAEFEALRAAQHPVVVISVEGLWGLQEPNVAYFKKLLGDATATVVYYVRSWADLLPSHYKQYVKHGRIVDTFPEYLYARVVNPRTNNMLNFGEGMSIYAGVFGKEAVKLVSYDQVLAQKLDLFEHFVASFLKISDLPAANLPRVNVSPSVTDIEILRALTILRTLHLESLADPRSGTTYFDTYMEHKNTPDVLALSADLEQYVDTIRINEMSAGLRGLQRELFEKFGDALVAPALKRFFFVPKRSDVSYVRPDYMFDPKIMAKIHGLHDALSKGKELVNVS